MCHVFSIAWSWMSDTHDLTTLETYMSFVVLPGDAQEPRRKPCIEIVDTRRFERV
jgi:hypothetical protein